MGVEVEPIEEYGRQARDQGKDSSWKKKKKKKSGFCTSYRNEFWEKIKGKIKTSEIKI